MNGRSTSQTNSAENVSLVVQSSTVLPSFYSFLTMSAIYQGYQGQLIRLFSYLCARTSWLTSASLFFFQRIRNKDCLATASRDVSSYSVCPAMPRAHIPVRVEGAAAWAHEPARAYVPVIDRLVPWLHQLGLNSFSERLIASNSTDHGGR
jgi:hypothetical protein